jgi:glycosyltransferase involved in cell wall biosynthesis
MPATPGPRPRGLSRACGRVIQVTVDDLDDDACGKSRSVSTLIGQFASHDTRLVVVSPRRSLPRWLVRAGCYAAALLYRPLGKAARHYLYSAPFVRGELARAVREAEADGVPYVVHARDFMSVLAFEAVRPAPSLGRVVLTVHCLASQADELIAEGHLRPGGPFERGIRRGERRAVALADAIVTQTSRGREALLEAFPNADAAKVIVIPNPVEVHFGAAPVTREDLGIQAGAFVAFSAVRMKRWKRLDLMVSAFAVLAKAVPSAYLVIAGDGYETERVRRFAAESGAADRILLLGRRGDVPDLIALSDAVVLTSERESFARILAEGALVGRPLVAFDAGALTDTLAEGESGYLVPFGDVEAMADRLAELAADPALRAAMGARARTRARALAPSAVAEAYVALYDGLCAGGAAVQGESSAATA